MRADGLFVITAIFFIFAAWVATGGPTRPISQAGPYITPVTRSGEESQGYRYIVPTNPINTSSYPKQVAGGAGENISSGANGFTRTVGTGDGGSDLYIEHSTIGPAFTNPNQEYVALVNVGGSETNVDGWHLESDARRGRVSLGSERIPAGGKLIVVTGRSSARDALRDEVCEGRTTACIFLNRNLELYAKTRETISLYDSAGKLVDTFSY
jgi:hypothetical protein